MRISKNIYVYMIHKWYIYVNVPDKFINYFFNHAKKYFNFYFIYEF